jgi:hypothetical protein
MIGKAISLPVWVWYMDYSTVTIYHKMFKAHIAATIMAILIL